MALTGKGLVKFAKSKLGTPYVYGAKGESGKFTMNQLNALRKAYPNMFTSTYYNKAKNRVGKVCADCSSLANSWYCGTKYQYGSAQLYQLAKKRIPISDWKEFPLGTVLWKSGHVGVYIGNGEVVEAKGIDYGTVKTKISSTPWKYGLLMPWVSYDETSVNKPTSKNTTAKKKNPYKKPTKDVKYGDRGEEVKWVQFELNEAGYNIPIDGSFGVSTKNATKKFQQSCKIKADGVVGEKTRAKLVADK